MNRLILLVLFALAFVSPSHADKLAKKKDLALPAGPGPNDGKTFHGRIAYCADGNHNDPDDWASSPVALAIIAKAGLKDRLVHFDYNCILTDNDLPGQIIVAGESPRYLKYNGGGPAFPCGPDNPEDFLFRGTLNDDGTRSGGQQEKLIERFQ